MPHGRIATPRPGRAAWLAAFLLCILAAVGRAGEGAGAATAAALDADAEAAAIDRLAGGSSTRVDDAVFLRRTWLVLGGRIPTLAEVDAFWSDPPAERRDRLIDRIAASPAWASRMFAWAADLLRVESRLQGRSPGQPWIDWLRARLHEDPRWDRIVRDQIASAGHTAARGNGATGFYLRDAGMPLDHLANAVQAFLGTRIGCAQCHDHPFDRWTRLEFYRLAACTSGVRVQSKPERPGGMRSLASDLADGERRALRQLSEVIYGRIEDRGGGRIALPADWKDDPAYQPKAQVGAAALYGELPADAPPREALAAWMTAPGNPRFALTIANRQWKLLTGRGLIEPVDDLKDETVAAAPPLLVHLADLMRRCDFDLRIFHRIVARTALWQQPLAEPRRLSAEQLWDSLVALSTPTPEAIAGQDAEGLAELHDRFAAAEPEAIVAAAREMASAQAWRSQRQQRASALRAQLKPMAPKDPAAKPLRDELERIGDELRRGSPPGMADLRRAEMRAAKEPDPARRASALPQPAPAAHPLRIFGQSDRLLIDNAVPDPGTPMALAMMNGPQIQALLRPSGLIAKTLAAAGPADRVGLLYRMILSRDPVAEEIAEAEATLRIAPAAGYGDIAWAMLNSAAFQFHR